MSVTFFKLSIRNLLKNKVFSWINLLGLSAGMAISFLMFEFVNFELSYDRFNKNAERIYRVCNDRYQNGKLILHGVSTYSAVSVAMKADFPEISEYTRIASAKSVVISGNGKHIGDLRELDVENSFLTIFSYPLEAGEKNTALSEPNQIVITKSLAKSLFSVTDNQLASLLGKFISLGTNPTLIKITGVCKDPPENSHLQFDFLISYITFYKGKDPFPEAQYAFTGSQYWQYILLNPNVNPKLLEAKFDDFAIRHFQGNKLSGNMEKFYLQPLVKAHLYSDFQYEIGNTFNGTTVWELFILAIFLLAIAWSNYINLAIAKSMDHCKTIALRKLLGASHFQQIAQLFTESLIINTLSLLIALMIVLIVQGYFNTLVNHNLSLSNLFNISTTSNNLTAFLFLVLIAGVFISGFYPSFVLRSINIPSVLKAKYVAGLKGTFFRKTLIVGQFTLAIILISSTIIIVQQMRFVGEQNLGFNKSQLLIIDPPILSKWDSFLLRKQNTFVIETKKLPGVLGAAFSWNVPGDELHRNYDARTIDLPSFGNLTVNRNGISSEFISVYQIKELAGRIFDLNDYRAVGIPNKVVILNEAAIKLFGFKSPVDAIGHKISVHGGEYETVGVISNFYQQSLHYPIEPTIFYPASGVFDPFSIKVDRTNIKETIDGIKRIYNEIFPGNLFKYYFLEDKFNRQYAEDELLEKSLKIFSIPAILIACVGLLGLSLYIMVQRTKEIGIRKVLGASKMSIILTLAMPFMRLVLIAILIGLPFSWVIMHKWLQSFVNHIDISPLVFIYSAFAALVTAFFTISIQIVMAASANPVNSLRSE
jgi:putative ABC transport system permease protein